MDKILDKVSIYKKSVVSFVIVLIIPTIILFLFLYFFFVNTLINETITQNHNKLVQFKTIFDTKMQEIHEVALSISLNNKMGISAKMEQNPYNSIQVTNEIRNYKRANSFIDDLFVYDNLNKNIWTFFGNISLADFFNNNYIFEKTEISELEEIVSTDRFSFLPVQTVKALSTARQSRMLVCVYPLKDSSNISVIFFIDEQNILHYMKNILSEYDNSTFIINRDLEVIASIDSNSLLAHNGNLIKEIIQTPGEEQAVEINRQRYHYEVMNTKQNDFYYLTFISENKITDKISKTMRSVFSIFLSVIILGAVIVAYLIKVNYKPIATLLKLISNSNVKNMKVKNEVGMVYEVISDIKRKNSEMTDTIKHLSHSNTNLRSAIDSTKPIVQKQLLYALLNGSVTELMSIYKIFDGQEILPNNCVYTVFVIEILHHPHEMNKENLLFQIKKALSDKEIKAYGIDVMNENRLVFVISQKKYRKLTGNYNMIVEFLSGENITAILGVGNPRYDILKISQSYMEAIMAVDTLLYKGNRSVLEYAGINKDEASSNWYPNDELTNLITEINIGNIKSIKSIIQDIILKTTENNIPLFAAKCLYYDIINNIIRVLYKFDILYDNVSNEMISALFIAKIQSFEQLNETINLVFEDITTMIKNKKVKTKIKDSTKIIEYINRNYADPLLSVSVIASELSLNYSHLSRTFKTETGRTIVEHISKVRMDEAKKLLLSTTMSIKEIVEKIGYIDVSNFSRKFKKTEGVSPMEYRKNHQL